MLTVHGVLRTGYDLQLPGDESGALFLTLEGDEGSGLILEPSLFERAVADEDSLIIWTGGLRLTVEAVDER